MKIKIFLLIVFVFTMSLSACGNLSDTGKENNSISLNTCPKETIQIVFEALKNANSKEFNQFTQYTE